MRWGRNISGSLSADFETGDVIGLSGHIYFPGLTGQGALVGRRSETRSPFVNLTHTYDRDWLDQMGLAKTGVYACLAGPHFETPAEGRMLQNMGADMVGMSTVHEAVMARYLDMRVLGLSLIVNPVITNPDAQIEINETDIWRGVKAAIPQVTNLINHALRVCPY
jgi:purine-nucleoside phosphorylase